MKFLPVDSVFFFMSSYVDGCANLRESVCECERVYIFCPSISFRFFLRDSLIHVSYERETHSKNVQISVEK